MPYNGPKHNMRQLAQVLGRNQGPEIWQSIAWPGLGAIYPIPKNLSLNRPCAGLRIILRMQVVIGTANYTSVLPEAPGTMIRRIQIRGSHVDYGQQQIVDISGATAQQYARLYQFHGNSTFLGLGGAQTRLATPSIPFTLAGATFGNTGTYNVETHYYIPFYPMMPFGSRGQAPFYSLNPAEWTDSLQISIWTGDNTSFGVPGGSTTVGLFSYGSAASGTPTIEVYPDYLAQGALSKLQGVSHGVVLRSEQQNVVLQNQGLAQPVLPTLQKLRTTAILCKTGLLQGGAGFGAAEFATLNDQIFDRTLMMVDTRPLWNLQANRATKEHMAFLMNTDLPQGYLPFIFYNFSGNPLTMFRGDTAVSGGSNFALQTDVLTGNTLNGFNWVQECILAPGKGLPRVKASAVSS